ncbi:MAG: MFS transporter [Acidobacteria bacterium]|nr:MFS transporter [Acidobacteriota bacterium]
MASYSVFQFLVGVAARQFERPVRAVRPILIYSQIGSFIGFLILGSAIHLPDAAVMALVARIIDGISGGELTTAQAYISDVTDPKDRVKAYGLCHRSPFGLGLRGPAMGGFLSRFGYDVWAYVAAGISFMSTMASDLLLPETHHKPGETRKFGEIQSHTGVFEYLRMSTLRPWLSVYFFCFSVCAYVSMFALFADR